MTFFRRHLLVCLLCNVLTSCWASDSEVSKLSRGHAEKACSDRGGLASHRLFPPILGTVSVYNVTSNVTPDDVTVTLEDGESAWVSGYAELSSFLFWHGCYTVKSFVNVTKVDLFDNSIFNCIEHCEQSFSEDDTLDDKENFYIGILENTCACFYKDISKIHTSLAEEGTVCGVAADSMSVFGLWTTFNVEQSHSPQLCVFAQKADDNIVYTPGNCIAHHSSICIPDQWNNLDSKCVTFHKKTYATSRDVCVSDSVDTWSGSIQTCHAFSGRLTPYVHVNQHRAFIRSGKKYWTGAFRSFNAIDKKFSSSDEVCLSVTRDGEHLYLQPLNCDEEIAYICTDDLITTKEPKDSDKRKVGVVGLLGLIIVLVITVICVRKIRKKSRRGRRVLVNSESEYDNNADVITHVTSSVTTPTSTHPESQRSFDASVHSNKDTANISDEVTKSTSVKIKPNKPIRHTLRRQREAMGLQSYENYTLKNKEDVESSVASDSYEDFQKNESPENSPVPVGEEIYDQISGRRRSLQQSCAHTVILT